jgi:hypothetical protein
MRTIDHNFRRDRIKWLIDRDPWDATYVAKGATGADAPTTGSFVCRFVPSSGYKGASRGLGIESGHSSEVASGLILAEWDVEELHFGDTVTLIHRESGVTRRVFVSFARHTPDKWEIEVDEIGGS